MINEILELSKINKQLIAISLYGETGFWCGFVEDYNEEFIQLRHFTKYGDLDGVAIEKISDIERIDVNDKYLDALKIIIENKGGIKDIEIKSRIFAELQTENWQNISLKPFENDENVLIGIQISNDNLYQGFVKAIDDHYLKIELISNEGDSEGISLFKIGDINSIKINDLECRRRLLIHQIKKSR